MVGLLQRLVRLRDEGGGDREGHATGVALVGLLPRVTALVIGQRAGLGERLAAHVTHVWLIPAVQSSGKHIEILD